MKLDITKLLSSLLICEGVGNIGTLLVLPALVGWYANLAKPSFTPPDLVFGSVWAVLFFLIGISFYLVWTAKVVKKNRNGAFVAFGVQLFLNFLWPVAFFGFKSPFYGFVETLFLLGSIIAMIVEFWKFSKKAALLLVPYLLWVSFAAILTFYVWKLN